MEHHHQAHAAAPPSLSLMRAGAITNSSSSITNSTTTDRRVSSVQLHGAGAAYDARERVIPMTPVLMASFPSQAPQSHGTESPYHTGQPAGAGSSYSLRRGLVRERQTPQWFTAAPLLSQFYNSQPPGSLLPPSTTAATATATTQSPSHHYQQQQQQQQQDQDQDDQDHHHSQSGTPLRTRGYEHYRFPSDAVSYRQQQQQHFYPRRLSHFELRGDETSPLLAAISSAPAPPPRTGILSNPNDDHQHESHHEHTAPPAKKRKKTAFRLRNFLCMHPGCGKSFTDNAHLRDHTFVHTGEKSLSCETCGKSFARLSTLHDHQRVHSGERPYSCSHPGCEKRYSSRAALRFHVAGHTSVTRQRSIGGGANGSTSSNIRNGAAATHRPVASEPLVLHLSGIHESRRSPTLEPGAQLPLQLHQHRHNGVASPSPPPGIANDTLYLHAKIQTQQTQIAELQAELQKLKRNVKKKKTQPSSTVASASKPNHQSALAAPMVAPVLFLVDGMKPFQCFVCYHKFANFFQLSFHAKQHPEADITDVVRAQEPLPVGPKFCPEADCEYAEKNQKPLKNLQTLKRHWQRRHQLSRPYVCALCSPNDPKTFKTKENLKAHEKDCKGGGGAAAVSVRGSARREHAVEAT